MMTYDVVVAGDYFVDLIFTGLPRLPELGIEIFGSGFEMLPGGSYNTAVAMHRLGLKVGWAVDFGNDPFSHFVLEHVAAEGLDDSLFVHHSRPLRRVTVSASYPEDRAFISYRDPDPAIPALMKKLTFLSSRSLFIPALYYGPFFEAGLALVRAKRMKLLMDCNIQDTTLEDTPAVVKTLQNLDVFLPNSREARHLSGKEDLGQAIRILAKFCPLVVVKDGANGAFASDGQTIIHVPAIPVHSVDTTGAGDCFNAGFVKAWLDGKSLEDCLRWANIAGGLSTLHSGGTRQVTTADEIERWLAKYD